MNYNGFIYSMEQDVEPDIIKNFHYVVTPEGKTIHMDWSSYSVPTREEFELYVHLGCPDRYHGALSKNRRVYSPLNKEDLITIAWSTTER